MPARPVWRLGVFDDSGHDLTQNRAAEVAAVLHLHFKPAADTQAANGGRREGQDDRFLNRSELLAELAEHYVERKAFLQAFLEWDRT